MHSVKEFLQEAFSLVDLDWEKYVECDKRYLRPTEVDQLLGDATKAKRELGWEPKVPLKDGLGKAGFEIRDWASKLFCGVGT